MRSDNINQFVAKHLSLPRFKIRKDLTRFLKMIGRQKYILDVGSGSNKPYKELIKGDLHIGIDLFEASDIRGNNENLPLADSTIDLVLCTEVLEHVSQPVAVLNEIRRVLKKRQYLILTVLLLWGEHDHIDYHRWTELGLRTLLRTNGFDILIFRRRGGLFSVIGCMFAQAPQQIFGTYADQKNWVLRIIYLLALVVMLPLPWMFSALDILDRKKKFVIGFSVLCESTEKDKTV